MLNDNYDNLRKPLIAVLVIFIIMFSVLACIYASKFISIRKEALDRGYMIEFKGEYVWKEDLEYRMNEMKFFIEDMKKNEQK